MKRTTILSHYKESEGKKSMKMFENMMTRIILSCLAFYGNHNRKRYISLSQHADVSSEKFLMKQIKKSKNTEYGKKYGFADIHNISDFQKNVPLSDYDDYKPYVDRMVEKGEQGLLTGNKVDYFSKTSGTIKVMKMIPTVKGSYKHYLRSCSVFIANLSTELKKKGHRKFNKGINLLESGEERTPSGIRTGYISGYGMGRANGFLKYITCVPDEVFGCTEPIDMKYVKTRYALQDPDLIFMMSVFMSGHADTMAYMLENYNMLVDDIEKGIINESIVIPEHIRSKLEKRLSPDPKRASELRKAYEGGNDAGIIPRIWPDMTLIAGIGGGEFAPFTQKMRHYAGPDIAFDHLIYGASEGMIGTALYVNDEDYLMLPDTGLMEFIPEDEPDATPLIFGQLEEGKRYELVLTNEAGLYRYKIKDVIKVTGFVGNAPLIHYAYRKEQIINIAGLHMTIEHAAETIKLLEESIHTEIRDYSLYADNNCDPGRIVLFIETEKTLPEETIKKLPAMFDEILAGVNVDYKHLQAESGDIAPAMVYVMKKGTYQNIREKKVKGKIAMNQIKSLRVIKNREQFDMMTAQAVNN